MLNLDSNYVNIDQLQEMEHLEVEHYQIDHINLLGKNLQVKFQFNSIST